MPRAERMADSREDIASAMLGDSDDGRTTASRRRTRSPRRAGGQTAESKPRSAADFKLVGVQARAASVFYSKK